MKHHQIVICIGPRCSAKQDPRVLFDRLQARLDHDPDLKEQLHVGSYECLSRCPAGPNILVRPLSTGEAPSPRPGMRDLNDASHYWSVDTAMLDRITDEHCLDECPIKGHHQRY